MAAIKCPSYSLKKTHSSNKYNVALLCLLLRVTIIVLMMQKVRSCLQHSEHVCFYSATLKLKNPRVFVCYVDATAVE